MWTPFGCIDFRGSPVQRTGTHRTNVTCLYSAFLQEKYTFLFSVFFYTKGQEGVETTFCCCTFQDNKVACPQWVRAEQCLEGVVEPLLGLEKQTQKFRKYQPNSPSNANKTEYFFCEWVSVNTVKASIYKPSWKQQANQYPLLPTLLHVISLASCGCHILFNRHS